MMAFQFFSVFYDFYFSIMIFKVRKTPIADHSKRDMEFHIIEWCKDKPTSYRKEREVFWIWKKKTLKSNKCCNITKNPFLRV